MRSLAFLLIFGTLCAGSLAAPPVGVLTWAWIALMNPHQYLWGFASNFPINLIQVVATFAAWGLSKEPKRIPGGPCTVLLFIFVVWITITSATSLSPDLVWVYWDRVIKNMILGLVIAGLMSNKVRVHALIWTAVFSLGYFGVKGGLSTILTGGSSQIVGEAGSFADNNNLALALCIILPLMNYLRLQSELRLVRLGLVGAMVLTMLAVLGTYSRGGLIGLLAMGSYLWWRSPQKVLLALCSAIVVMVGLVVMPANWKDRMNTIQTAEEDGSFQGRVQAWKFAINIAAARPLVGGGFGASETGSVFNRYSDEYLPNGRAAHSIYFQVLGDHGVVGLGIFLGLMGMAWHQCTQIRKRVVSRPDLKWAADLTTMIQVSWLGYMVAGAALSMAYYDLVYVLIGTLIALRDYVRRTVPEPEAKSTKSRMLLPQVGRGAVPGTRRAAALE